MSYLDPNLINKLAGSGSTEGTTGTSGAAVNGPTGTKAAEAIRFLQSYEDELMELDETSASDLSNVINGNATIEEIDELIEAKTKELTELQTKTEDFTKKCQQEIQKIFANGTDVIPEEVQTKYNNELSTILSTTSSNTSSMLEQSAIITENEITVSKAEKEIEQKEDEIAKKEKEISSLQGKEDDASIAKVQELQSEIASLKSEIRTLNYVITQSTRVIEEANEEYESLKSENNTLSQKQSDLMNTLMEEYYKSHSEEDRVYEDSGLKFEIEGLEQCIKEANLNLATNTIALCKDIETLTKQKSVKQQEILQAQASASGTSTTSTNFPITGSGYSGDLPVNNELAQIAGNMANSMGTTGWCLKGVNNSLEKAYGFRLSYNSAYQAIPALQARQDFTEVTNQYPNAQSLTNLPAGAIVVWENSGNHPHGHISIALGNGQEASDHVQNQTVNYGTQYHVFIKNN